MSKKVFRIAIKDDQVFVECEDTHIEFVVHNLMADDFDPDGSPHIYDAECLSSKEMDALLSDHCDDDDEPTDAEITSIIEAHQLWLSGENIGGRADFSGMDIGAFNFDGMNLEKANFRGANLERASFVQANLTGADFEGAILTDAELTGVTATRANFDNAVLNGAGLAQANCCDASFRQANLMGAIAFKADFTGANMMNANLQYAELAGAIGLQPKKSTKP